MSPTLCLQDAASTTPRCRRPPDAVPGAPFEFDDDWDDDDRGLPCGEPWEPDLLDDDEPEPEPAPGDFWFDADDDPD
jgi:hypothetical protein